MRIYSHRKLAEKQAVHHQIDSHTLRHIIVRAFSVRKYGPLAVQIQTCYRQTQPCPNKRPLAMARGLMIPCLPRG